MADIECVDGGVDLGEIAEKYDDKGFFERLGILFKGINKPRDTREYKLARV